MRVVMLSDEETVGGAAIAASRLGKALVSAGVEVVRVVGHPDDQPHAWTTRTLIRQNLRIGERPVGLERHVARWSPGAASCLRRRRVRRQLDDVLREAQPDIVNVHNLHSAGWVPGVVATCLQHAPTAWTLHDMWSFTGRCAYAYECRKFISGCDAACPTPTEYPALEPQHIGKAWRARGTLLSKYPALVAVCPSRWMADEARRGCWAGHRVELLPYGLPLETYRPLPRSQARDLLGLDRDGLVALVAAQVLTERRKGGPMLVPALAAVTTRPFTILLLGKGAVDVCDETIRVHALGYVQDEVTKTAAYAAADVLLHPAPVDNLPNVVLEALACGTPCVAFPIGGLPDAIRPGVTGWLADSVTSASLGATLDRAFADIGSGIDLRQSSRAVAEKEYGMHLQAHRYIELFRSMLVRDRTSSR